MSIDMESLVVRNNEMMSSAMDRELVILNMAKGNYVGLDEIGRRIWELLETPLRAEELCGLLGREFDASPEQITADVLPFLVELENEGMVHDVTGRRSA